MKYPYAAKGAKKIFIGEIIALIAVLAISIPEICLLLIPADIIAADRIVTIILSVSMLAGGVITIAAAVIRMIGLVQASKQELSFKGVIYLTLVGVAIAAVQVFISSDTVANSVLSILSEIIDVIATILIIIGFCNIANREKRQDVMAAGAIVFKLVIFVGLFAVIVSILILFLDTTWIGVIALVDLILSLVQYIFFLLFLVRVRKALAELRLEQAES